MYRTAYKIASTLVLGLGVGLAWFAVPASAHGSQVKITDDASGKSYQPQYADVTVNTDSTLSFWGITVKRGTIVFADGIGGALHDYTAIPVNRNSPGFRDGQAFKYPSAPVAAGPAVVGTPASVSGSGTSGSGAGLVAQGGGNLITNDGGGPITNDGGGIISNDGGGIAPSGSYGLQSSNGKPIVYGKYDAHQLSCGLAGAVYVPRTGRYYYTAFATGVKPSSGMYVCVADAKKIGLTSGGTYH